MKERISLATARRIAIAAQGFTDPPPTGPVTRRHLARVLARTNLLQIDSVNVLVRAHYMPLFSRLGPYPQGLLDDAAWSRRRTLFEYWAHEASLLPMELHPLLRWRMERAARYEGIYSDLGRFAREKAAYVETVFGEVRQRGAIAAADLEGERGPGGWWGWGEAKIALEWLFWAGRLTTGTRRGTFERLYDLPERVIPADVLDLPTPEPADAQRRLVSLSARSLGVATAADLRDYFRLSPGDADQRIAELVEEGELLPVAVEGIRPQAYVHRDAKVPRRIEAAALLAPFDPLVWERTRTERLFGFHYRIEIYIPAEKRRHGYYVLPFLLGDRLVGRVDLKADRALSALNVVAAFTEGHAPADTAARLAEQLRLMAQWLDLERVSVQPAGDLGPALAGQFPV